MWEAIALDLEKNLNLKKTAIQCENRYKTVMKRKTNAVTKRHRTGESPETIPFHDGIEKINAIDDSIEPEVNIKFLFAEKCRNENVISFLQFACIRLFLQVRMDATSTTFKRKKEEEDEGKEKKKMKKSENSLTAVIKSLHEERE